ncbi:MAG: diguanylate cyclase, partial [Oscillospiraceae bacterium]|nr:diguanylate cyclase [Oscillospiraceae bacterium]
MILYFAPMEGITSCVFRQVHARCFPGVDGYYAPFLAPDGQGRCKASALRELLPENNRDLKLTPQILT